MNIGLLKTWAAVLALTLAGSLATAAAFTPGNVVVLRVGDGSATLSNAGTAQFLDEYKPTGEFVQTIALPTATSGSNLPCIGIGNSTTEGVINVSANGQYIVAGGYDAPVGTANATVLASGRVVARVAMNGTVDTTTRINNITTSGNCRCVTSTDGTAFWIATSSSGIVYAPFGMNGPGVQLNTVGTNMRTLAINSGQLYVGSASTPFRGISTVGTGLPTVDGQTLTILPGFPGDATDIGMRDFKFASATKIWAVSDLTLASNGGVMEWTLNAGTWSRQATSYSTGLTVPLQGGLALGMDGSTPSVFVTTVSRIYKMSTTSPGTLTEVATAPTNTAFRGIVTVPTGSAVSDWTVY